MVDAKNEQGPAAIESPFKNIIPGEGFALSNGRTLIVRPWSARAITQDIPALIGKLFGKMSVAAGAGTSPGSIVQWFVQHSMGDLLEIVKYSSGLTDEDVDQISADELLALAQVVVRQNKSFFARAASLYETFTGRGDSGSE